MTRKTKTDITKHPALEALLAWAKTLPPMTEEQKQAQRESWVRGEMAIGGDKEEAAYRTQMSASKD